MREWLLDKKQKDITKNNKFLNFFKWSHEFSEWLRINMYYLIFLISF